MLSCQGYGFCLFYLNEQHHCLIISRYNFSNFLISKISVATSSQIEKQYKVRYVL